MLHNAYDVLIYRLERDHCTIEFVIILNLLQVDLSSDFCVSSAFIFIVITLNIRVMICIE